MLRTKWFRLGFLGAFLAGLVIACAQGSSPSSPLLVAAAASLQPALQEITTLYTQAYPHQTIRYHFAASGTLQQQIEQGAPVDVFFSAARQQIDSLNQKGLLIPESIQDILTNQLVLIVPKTASVSLANFAQLTQPEVKRIAMGEPRSVPAGQYAMDVLKNLGIWTQVQGKLVLGNNVKAVLAAVVSGEVDAGLVYRTDVKDLDSVVIAAIAPASLHRPIRYSVAIVKASFVPDAAQQYLKFLQSTTAQTVFKKYGFGIAKS